MWERGDLTRENWSNQFELSDGGGNLFRRGWGLILLFSI